VALPGSKVVLIHLTVERSRKEMKERGISRLRTDMGVALRNQHLSKTTRTLSTPARKGSELAHGEVAREHCHDIKKASLGLGVAKLLDPLNVRSGNLHSGEISFVLSLVRGTLERIRSCRTPRLAAFSHNQ